METLISRPYAGPAELHRLIDLLLTSRAVESVDPWPPIHEMRHYLRAGGPDLLPNTRVWANRAGAPMAFATIWDGATLVMCVHPQAQSDELAAQIVEWAVERAREHGRASSEQPTLLVPVLAEDASTSALLQRHGFAAEDWSILRMGCRLDEPIPAPQLPAGFRLRPVASAEELAAAAAMHQEVFVAASTVVRDRLALSEGSQDIQAIDLVAETPDGAFAAFCLCSASRDFDTRHYRHEGWIDLLGTRPAYRRRGLGRAALLAGLRLLADQGVDVALLGTTSWNVAAQRLFVSSGFRTMHQLRWFAWEAGDHA